jgi:hypothetical protein
LYVVERSIRTPDPDPKVYWYDCDFTDGDNDESRSTYPKVYWYDCDFTDGDNDESRSTYSAAATPTGDEDTDIGHHNLPYQP